MRTIDAAPLDDKEITRIDRYWRAANYLAVGQIYLLANPLLREAPTPHRGCGPSALSMARLANPATESPTPMSPELRTQPMLASPVGCGCRSPQSRFLIGPLVRRCSGREDGHAARRCGPAGRSWSMAGARGPIGPRARRPRETRE